jgi:uncharacterized protein YggU (UPF0235/DUF167 family)
VRITVRVRPGASRTRVGGRYGEPPDRQPALVVAVNARAVDGAANAAVVAAVAKAFGVRPAQVRLISGERARTKVVELRPAPPDAEQVLAQLLAR